MPISGSNRHVSQIKAKPAMDKDRIFVVKKRRVKQWYIPIAKEVVNSYLYSEAVVFMAELLENRVSDWDKYMNWIRYNWTSLWTDYHGTC